VKFVSNEGIRFAAGWNTAYSGGVMDSLIGYTATAATDKVINSVGLTMGYPAVTNGGVASVSESIWAGSTNAGSPIKGLYVVSDGSGPIADKLYDSTTFDPGLTQVTVLKDISVTTNGQAGSFASVTFVENWIGTGPGGGNPPPVIPEPASLVLLPLALAGLSLRKKLAR
jgi:hypothetical protein